VSTPADWRVLRAVSQPSTASATTATALSVVMVLIQKWVFLTAASSSCFDSRMPSLDVSSTPLKCWPTSGVSRRVITPEAAAMVRVWSWPRL
jgi:hypothetical protein